MTRCTVCGATSREGAKFCTSCGSPLADDAQEQEATPTPTTAERDDTSAPASPSATTDSDNSGARDEDDDSASSTSRDSGYVSSWPGADSTDEQERAATNTDQEQATVTASRDESAWPSASTADSEAKVVTSDAPESFATDADQDPRPSDTTSRDGSGWRSVPVATDDDPIDEKDDDDRVFTSAAPTSFATDADQDARTAAISDDHGASDWEGWAPTASGPSTASSSFDEHLDHARKLVDELRHRIERLGQPADLASRDLDPDDLADQLERWSRALPNSDELFEIVQEVRRSPRDIDAMVRLADHAADLELLVRHYQSITSTSDQWAADLRRTR